jgi:hypothetical protein
MLYSLRFVTAYYGCNFPTCVHILVYGITIINEKNAHHINNETPIILDQLLIEIIYN